ADDFFDCGDSLGVDLRGVHSGHLSNLQSVGLLYLGIWLSVYMNLELALRALSNERRLRILDWLRSPRRHFPPQVDGDLIKDGVCGLLIARKLKVTQPTASEHLKILQQAGLIRGKRIKQWTFYKRDEAQIVRIKRQFLDKV